MAKVTVFQIRRNIEMGLSRIEHIEDALRVMKNELQSALDDIKEIEIVE